MGAASQLEPSTFGIYQVRNRVLIPRYGRWAQKDPNASGMLHASLWHEGQSPSPDLAAGSLEAMLGDGANLFAFVGNSPLNATDPSGLFSLAGLLGVTGKAVAITAPWMAASAMYTDVVAYNNNEITGRDLALGLLFDAILGGTFFKVGRFVDDYFSAIAKGGSRAVVRAVRQFVPDAVLTDPRTFRRWLQQYGNPNGVNKMPKSAIQEVSDKAAQIGFTDIKHEIGGIRSSSWKDKPHINMSAPDGGRRLHILTE